MLIYYTGTRCVRLSEYGAETAKRVWIRSAAARCRPGRLGFPLWVTHHLDDFDQRRREREKKKIIINCSLTNKETCERER